MATFGRSNKVILADSDPLFRERAAKAVAGAHDMRIVAHCTEPAQVPAFVTSFPGSIVLFSAAGQSDLTRLLMLLETTGSRGVVVVEEHENPAVYLQQGFSGVVFRSAGTTALLDCLRHVAIDDVWMPTSLMKLDAAENERASTQARSRLTPTEMQLLSTVAFGLCTRLRQGVGESMRPFGSR